MADVLSSPQTSNTDPRPAPVAREVGASAGRGRPAVRPVYWSALMDSLQDGLFIRDRRGVVLEVNSRFCQMTGFSPEELVGQAPPSAFWPPEERQAIEAAMRQYLSGTRGEFDLIFQRKGGERFPVILTSAPFNDAAGQPAGAVVTVKDMTERKASEESLRARARELEAMARSLKRSNEELDNFAYVASHDLKAPLRGIANLSEWIEEDLGDRFTPEAREQMVLLRGRVRRMEALIEGILQYSRAGRVRAEPQAVDVGALLNEVVDLLHPPGGFRIEIGAGMPTLFTDRLRLQQVFLNLVGNAIKHHHRPEGRVVVTVAEPTDAPGFYEFTVADDGPGIAPQYHQKIFVIFQTLSARDKVEGTGVGLSLVKKMVEDQCGTIRVESQEGAGARFIFTWPK